MMIDITGTRAYKNQFFTLAQRSPVLADLRAVICEWYPVTQAFCLNLQKYNALFAQEVLSSSGQRRKLLEEAMLTPIRIAAEEFGLGESGVGGIHYRMFARLAEPSGIDIDYLENHPLGHLTQTADLVSGICKSFEDLYLGAACLRVVEGTAYEIVRAMQFIFAPGCNRSYSDFQLEYITLHLVIEKEHDSISSDFLALLSENESEARKIECGIEKMCGLFGNFWESLSLATFSHSMASTYKSVPCSEITAVQDHREVSAKGI
jgi:hypothetical protein